MAVVVSACGKASSPTNPGGERSKPAAKLDLELDWVPNPDHVALYYAQQRGHFSKQNLQVTLRAPSNAADPIKLVGLGKVGLAISYESEMFFGQREGLPVVAVATLIPVPLNSLIVSPRQRVTSLSQLAGKKIGITGIPSDQAIYLTAVKTAGLTTGQVRTVTVGQNLVTSLLGGKVDAILGGYRNVEAIQIEQETGQKPAVFPASALGVPSYAELVIVANKRRLESDPAYADQVRRFLKGLVAATDAVEKAPEDGTRLMREVSQYTPKFLDVSVPATISLLRSPDGTKTGCIDQASWQGFGDWMAANKLITGKPDASAIATNAYLPYVC